MNILEMNLQDLLNLDPFHLDEPSMFIGKEEVKHIFHVCNAVWFYDYEAAKKGKVGKHALLKSGRCSDGFIIAPEVLKYPNLRMLLAMQLALRFGHPLKPDRVVGIPAAAKELGDDVGHILGVGERGGLIKEDGKMKVCASFRPNEYILLVEDVCTKGTGFTEGVLAIYDAAPSVQIMPMELVIFNRGGMKTIRVGETNYTIAPLVENRIQDWDKSECPLCEMGSIPIKPKVSPESWQDLINSQRA